MERETERTLQNKVLRLLESLENCYVFKVVQANRAGVPDVIACLNGEFFAFELKRDYKEKTSKVQNFHLAKIEKAGGKAFVIRDLGELKNILVGYRIS